MSSGLQITILLPLMGMVRAQGLVMTSLFLRVYLHERGQASLGRMKSGVCLRNI